MSTENAEINLLWSYFPQSSMNNPDMNMLLAAMFKPHTHDVIRAVLGAHRTERKYNDPCIPTIKRMLEDARQQMTRTATTSPVGECQSVQAMRAWAIAVIGPECRQWDGRKIVSERIKAEWYAIPIDRRPKPGTEMNFGPWIGMIQAAGGNPDAGRVFLENLTGCKDITKYDGLDNREMYRRYCDAVAVLNSNAKEANGT